MNAIKSCKYFNQIPDYNENVAIYMKYNYFKYIYQTLKVQIKVLL